MGMFSAWPKQWPRAPNKSSAEKSPSIRCPSSLRMCSKNTVPRPLGPVLPRCQGHSRDSQLIRSPLRSQPWQNNSALCLVLPLLILVADFAILVALKEQYLAQSFVGIDLCGQRRGVADLQSNKSLPLGLKWRHIHDDSAARIGGFSQAHGQHIPRNSEIFD